MHIRDKTGKDWECVLNSAQKSLSKAIEKKKFNKQLVLIKRRGRL